MKTIQFNNGIGRYDDVSPFVLTEGKLELKIKLPKMNGEFYLIAENNGKKDRQIINPEDGNILIGLTEGELNVEVKHYLRGELIKTYKVEPLILKQVYDTLSGTPEIALLLQRTEMLDKSIARERLRIDELYIERSRQERNLLALIKFAYTDYVSNVYLSGGSVDKFIREFGFDLTEEERKFVEGETEND